MSEKRRGRPPTYDWDRFTNGERHVVYKGRDFEIELASFRALVYRTANARGMGVSTKVNVKGESLIFQFYPED